MLAEYFAWNGASTQNTDAAKMVEVVEEVINNLHESGKLTSPKDIMQVYCQITSLKIYRETRKKFVRTKADAGLAYNTWNGKNNDKLIPAKPKWKYVANKYSHNWSC
ncbi:hypothetical protein C1646_754552 [Rhizophagus diaphanus]|nr:hypothetical protein C1646_754552 [Rhizophagus diaphanus] [Rhizophagus sp. MUCL 43196]